MILTCEGKLIQFKAKKQFRLNANINKQMITSRHHTNQ